MGLSFPIGLDGSVLKDSMLLRRPLPGADRADMLTHPLSLVFFAFLSDS